MNYSAEKDQNIIRYIFDFIKKNALYFIVNAGVVFGIIAFALLRIEKINIFTILDFSYLTNTNNSISLILTLSGISILISSTIYKVKNPKEFNLVLYLKKIVTEITLFTALLLIGFLNILVCKSFVFIYLLFPFVLYFASLFFMFTFYTCIILSTNFSNYIKIATYLVKKKTINLFTDLTRYIIILVVLIFGLSYLLSILNQLIILIFHFSILNSFTITIFKYIGVFFALSFSIGYIIYLEMKANKEYKIIIGQNEQDEIENIGSNNFEDEI